jgi:hypothetical protein
MSVRSLLGNHHDPFWEVDGPAARREQRLSKARSVLAFTVALGAVAFAAFAWSVQLGLAAMVGIRLTIAIG